ARPLVIAAEFGARGGRAGRGRAACAAGPPPGCTPGPPSATRGRGPGNAGWSGRLSEWAGDLGDKVTRLRSSRDGPASGADIGRKGPYESIVGLLLHYVGRPACDTAH